MSTPLVLTPKEDASVNSSNPNAVYNKQGLAIGKWSSLNRSLLKFDLQGIRLPNNSIKSVELKLYGKAVYLPITVEVHCTLNNFNEKLVTWATQPKPSKFNGKSLMGSSSNIPTGLGWFSVPIDPAFITARLGFGFMIILQSGKELGADNYCYAADKEGEPELRPQFAPQLVIIPRV
jgi:hypothetical protein